MHRTFDVMIPHIAHLTVPAYSLFAFIGLFFMMVFLCCRIQKMRLQFKDFLVLMLFMLVGVGIGSKFVFILTRIPEILTDFSMENVLRIIITSGFVFYGGLLGAIIGIYIFAKKYDMIFSDLADIVAPGFPLFHFWGRVGCFFAGCCYGKKAAWGIALENEPGVPRIPIQLFESACLLLIFFVLLYLEKKSHNNIPILHVYLFLYAICRFNLEFFRGDTIRGIWFGLSTSQWISMSIFFYIIWRARRYGCIHQ